MISTAKYHNIARVLVSDGSQNLFKHSCSPVQSDRLNSTRLNEFQWDSFHPTVWCQSTPLSVSFPYLLKFMTAYVVQKCRLHGKCSCRKNKLLFRFTVPAVDMDIHGYIHVCRPRCECVAMDVWYQCLISDIRMTLLSVCALETQTSCCYWGCFIFSSSFFVLLIPLSHQNLHTLLLSENVSVLEKEKYSVGIKRLKMGHGLKGWTSRSRDISLEQQSHPVYQRVHWPNPSCSLSQSVTMG